MTINYTRAEIAEALRDVLWVASHNFPGDVDRFDADAAIDAIMAGDVTPDCIPGTSTTPSALAFGAFMSDGPWWR